MFQEGQTEELDRMGRQYSPYWKTENKTNCYSVIKKSAYMTEFRCTF